MLEHRTYAHEKIDNIIIFTLTGDFNEQGIAACLKAEKEAIEKCHEDKCYLLIDCTNQGGATPEIYREIDRFFNELSLNNLSAIAVVHTSYPLIRLHYRDLPALDKYQVKIFEDRNSALSWLKSF